MLSFARIPPRLGLVFFAVLTLLVFTIFYVPFSRLTSSYYHRLTIPPPSSHSSLAGHFPSLRHVCDSTDWTDGLWLHCHNRAGPSKTSIKGGLSNARNRIQTCLRLAISAGAGVIVLSPIATRTDGNLLNYPNEQCPDDFWDIDLFQHSLSTACPQLKVRPCNDTTNIPTVLEANYRKYLDPSHLNGTFRALLDTTMASGNITRGEISAQKPVRIVYGDTYLAWNYTASLETELKKDLFRTLRYNSTLLGFGKQVFDALKRSSEGPVVAIHLRGEADWPRDFGDVETQIAVYTEELERLRTHNPIIRDVYVSCGAASATAAFRQKLEALGYVVHDKYSVLATQPEVLDKIEALSFDERAVTEYESLVAADYFLGILTSSLSAVVAYARTADEGGDYFEEFIHPGTTRTEFIGREYPGPPGMRGDEKTRLLVLTGPDIMDCYP